MKKYIAKTNVSINVVLASGANRHISFSSLTGGGSVFYTDDSDLIRAMERHYKFGTLFRVDTKFAPEKPHSKPIAKPKREISPEQPPAPLVASEAQAPAPAPSAEEADTPAAPAAEEAAIVPEQPPTEDDIKANDEEADDDQADEVDEDAPESEYKTIVVSDPDSAKSYLAEHFGYSRTKIKSIKAIKEAAAAHGIVFEGI